MAYLKEKGIISSYDDYRRLPYGVLEDARMLAEGEALEQQRKYSASRGHESAPPEIAPSSALRGGSRRGVLR